ncbi:MAG: hypothetical protein A3G24_07190 [Betaproteobacteria bacterium RIFCSPLOWO2_12_FULL_62_13]|nr:MAG: hypothetical protein A3G24_07190 [Betaproteobacteria bacterium RIFCSPLOWO2_12_FULL_62_13]
MRIVEELFVSGNRPLVIQDSGNNTAGTVAPGECFAGFMPAFDPRIPLVKTRLSGKMQAWAYAAQDCIA